jgi:uncharacterized protein YcfL
MKSALIFSLLACVLLGVTSASAAGLTDDVEIKVDRQKLDEEVTNSGPERTSTKEIRFTVTVQSKTFKQLSNLEAKYMIFYYDSKPGSAAKPTEQSQSGSEKIIALAGNQSVNFETKSITLTTVTLDGGWVYSSGASSKSKDRVSGVWVRVFSEGKLVGEYTSPTTIKKRDWKD